MAISVDELKKTYDTINISKEKRFYPFSKDKTAEFISVDLVHDNGSMYYIHIEFSPLGVFYTGDMGSFTFNGRLMRNPATFFCGESINPKYWSEKLCAATRDYYTPSIDTDALDNEFRKAMFEYKLSDYTGEAVNDTVKALKLSYSDFQQWCIQAQKYGDCYVQAVTALYEMQLPSSLLERDTMEAAYDAVMDAATRVCNKYFDPEWASYVVQNSLTINYQYIYACTVLQWVCNMLNEESKV